MAQTLHSLYQQNYYHALPRGFDEAMDSMSPSPMEDPELVPILDREDNSDLSRPDSSISSYSSRSSTYSLCALDDKSLPYPQPPAQKCQLPRAPPPTPFVASPQVSPLNYGLGIEDDRELYAAPFVLSASLLELEATLGNLFPESEDYGGIVESTCIPFEYKHKHIPESWSLPCSFDEPIRYTPPAPQTGEYNNKDYPHPLQASFDDRLFITQQAPSVNSPTPHTKTPLPPTPPPSRCSLEEIRETRPWPLAEIEDQLRALSSDQSEAEKEHEQDEIAELERPTRRSHKGPISKLSKAWKGYLHRP